MSLPTERPAETAAAIAALIELVAKHYGHLDIPAWILLAIVGAIPGLVTWIVTARASKPA